MTSNSPAQRPSINPGVLATILSAAPERLQKRLDREPRAADAWEWTETTDGWNVAAGEETVTMPAGVIREISQVKCTCLLSPRCFHVLATLSIIEIANDVPRDEAGGSGDQENETAETSSVSQAGIAEQPNPSDQQAELIASQHRAVRLMFEAASGVLTAGLRAAGSVQQSRLLRAIHECRSEGLHRLAAGGLRLMNNLRSLRDGDDGFSSNDSANDFSEILETCVRLERRAQPMLPWIGIARRSFEPVQNLKLHALFCEPLVTRSGYAGVVTWLMADDGWIGSVSDVQPGDAKRIPQAWQSGVTLAGLSISHRELSQKCLLISKATRSIDGRLGGGESARAVVIDGLGWDAAPIAAKFQVPLADQIRRAFENPAGSDFLQPAGTDLLFFTAMVVGYSGHDLIVQSINCRTPLKLGIANDHESLAFRDSLQTLSRAPGLVIRCLGRLDMQSAGRVLLLAVAPSQPVAKSISDEGADDKPSIVLKVSPEKVRSIGLNPITRSQLSRAEAAPVEVVFEQPIMSLMDSYEDSLERWLKAIAIGGRHAIPHVLLTSAAQDVARLKTSLRPASAALLRGLTQATITARTDISGVRLTEPPGLLAQRWLAASLGSRKMMTQLQLKQWLELCEK